jgi:hypothetical protein
MSFPDITRPCLRVTGRFPRVARLHNEYYEFIDSPSEFVAELKTNPDCHAHLFTFVPAISQCTDHLKFYFEMDSAAVLNITTYEKWWKSQINDKTRNMVRKAAKSGVEIKDVEYSDHLVEGIARIYNETPLRQGRRFRHFGKPISTINEEHGTFLNRSEFIGAYHGGVLIGFIKLVHGQGVSNLMQIISMISHRDKAPTNALIAKAVERCASRGIGLLHYGTWSRRSMGDFKKHHGFVRMEIPRYYVALNLIGAFLLKCGLHRELVDRIPEAWLDRLAILRSKWNTTRYRNRKSGGAVAQLAERHS